MMRRALFRVARWMQVGAALVLFTLSCRFALGAVRWSIERSARPTLERVGNAPRGKEADGFGLPSVPLPSALLAPLGSATLARDKANERVYLMVSAGPERSELFVNGVFKGHSPFVGEIHCKPGEPVVVELVPEDKAPIRFERTCAAGTVRVE